MAQIVFRKAAVMTKICSPPIWFLKLRINTKDLKRRLFSLWWIHFSQFFLEINHSRC